MAERFYCKLKSLELAHRFGYLWDHEVLAMQVLSRSLPAGSVYVNVGAGTGTSSLAVFEANKDLKMTTVDISRGGPLGGLENEVNTFNEFECIEFVPNQILGDSYVVGTKVWEGEIDFLFIDADHSAEALEKDIKAWFPHLKHGGIVAYHDYGSPFWPDVKKVVDRDMAKQTPLFVVDTLAVFRKK